VIAVAVGAALGVAAEIFAFVGRSDCAEPALGDPNFAAKSAAWGACDDQNIKHMALYGALGLGALAAGGITALAIAPKRSDIMEVLNKNNRLAPQPLQLELGYDPARRYAFAGAGVSF
jgi:ABC-type enterobactin transport system permease subunit